MLRMTSKQPNPANFLTWLSVAKSFLVEKDEKNTVCSIPEREYGVLDLQVAQYSFLHRLPVDNDYRACHGFVDLSHETFVALQNLVGVGFYSI